MGFTALLFGFTSCNKHCVCTVTKDNQLIQEYDYSNQGLKRDECTAKGDSILTDYITNYGSESLIGLTVQCEHL